MGRFQRHPLSLACLAFAAACGGGKSSSAPPDGGPAREVLPPTVVATTPKDGAGGVLLDATVTATFSEAMSPDSMAGALELSPAVPGTLKVEGTALLFKPASSLAYATRYTATVKTSARDLAGNALKAPVRWTFTTIPLPPAPVAITDLSRDVNTGEPVTLDASRSQSASGRPLNCTWRQLSGDDVTAGTKILSGVQPQFVAPAAVGTLQFALVVNDGLRDGAPVDVQVNVMQDKSRAVFVSASGNDLNAGSRAAPMRTLRNAIRQARASGAGLYVAEGDYREAVELATGVSLYGAFRVGTWVRDRAAVTRILSPTSKAVTGMSVGNVVLDGFSIQSAAASSAGDSSCGILLSASAGVTISNNDITAGNGANGAAGANGAGGANGASGASGGRGCVDSRTCPGAFGGAGGAGPGGSGGAGGGGGGAGVAPSGANGVGALAGVGGAGGPAGDPGFPGGNGGRGHAGVAGADGSPAMAGSATASGYLPGIGRNGADGTSGSGGGGGGGGGGQSCTFCFLGTGNGAGGGGAGGAGGRGGGGGLGGGGSFAILLFQSDAVERGNTFHLGVGGLGGPGGQGGPGGSGGFGGAGAREGLNEIGAGGNGGPGGAGGAGGHGGRGSDGPTMSVFKG